MLDPEMIRQKFGDDYQADENTFRMGIGHFFSTHLAGRLRGRTVLETCTGAGFTAIALAKADCRVITVEIDPRHQAQARANVDRAGLSRRVTFLSGDILDSGLLAGLPPVDAALLDPDWAVTGPGHVHRFRRSNTRPPADLLLETILALTPHVALVLPPLIDPAELAGLPPHEREKLYLDGSHELYCLYFGGLAALPGESEFVAEWPRGN